MSPSSRRRAQPPAASPPRPAARPKPVSRPKPKAVKPAARDDDAVDRADDLDGVDDPDVDVAGDDYDEDGYYGPDEDPTNVPYGRLGAAAGIAYALVGFVGSSLLPAGKVSPTDPSQVVARQLTADRGRVSAGILLTLFSMFFLIVFVAWLYRWLRDIEGDGWLANLTLVGGILEVGGLLVVVVLSIGATVLDRYGADPVIARTLLVLQWQAIAIAFVPTAAFVGGIAALGFTSAQLPRWMSYSGFALALGLLVPPVAFLPFLLSNLWTGLLAIYLLQRSRGRR